MCKRGAFGVERNFLKHFVANGHDNGDVNGSQ